MAPDMQIMLENCYTEPKRFPLDLGSEVFYVEGKKKVYVDVVNFGWSLKISLKSLGNVKRYRKV